MKTEFNPHGYPELVTGVRVDGSPIVIAAQFRGNVRVADSTIYVEQERWSYDVAEAKELARGLKEAIDWIEGDLSLAVEKFYAQRIAEAPESVLQLKRSPVKRRIAVPKAAPLCELAWSPEDERREAHLRPWIAETQNPYRYAEHEVIELTDVDMMKVTKHSLREVVDFMGAEDYAKVIDEWPDTFHADLRNPGGGTVRLTWNTYVWKVSDGRCYVLGHGENAFKTWAPEVQPS